MLAGLLVHSFIRLYQVHPGVRVDNVLTMGTTLAGPNYRDAATRSVAIGALGDRLRTVPGVNSAGMVSCPPVSGSCNVLFFYIEGKPYVPGKFFAALERSADPGYFGAAGIPLVRGRTFTRDDGVGFDPKNPKPGQVVISESMAKQFFPGEDPLGKRIFFDFEIQREKNEGLPAPRYEVIGIVGDVLPMLHERIAPTLYRPMLDVAMRGFSIFLHTSLEPHSVVASARAAVRQLDPGLAVFQVRTMEDLLGQSTADRRFNVLLDRGFRGPCDASRRRRAVRHGVLCRVAADDRDWPPHGARGHELRRPSADAPAGAEANHRRYGDRAGHRGILDAGRQQSALQRDADRSADVRARAADPVDAGDARVLPAGEACDSPRSCGCASSRIAGSSSDPALWRFPRKVCLPRSRSERQHDPGRMYAVPQLWLARSRAERRSGLSARPDSPHSLFGRRHRTERDRQEAVNVISVGPPRGRSGRGANRRAE